LLTGLLLKRQISKILIISPVSVLHSWENELKNHLAPYLPHCNILLLNSDVPKKKRSSVLASSFTLSSPTIVISSHQIVSGSIEDFRDLPSMKWDYVILDEGHVIKNPSTKLYKSMSELPSVHRILCTGTPVQNNLMEFWALIDWATKGTVFGSMKTFQTNIADPIAKGQNPNAKSEHIDSAVEAIQQLSRLSKPIILQRKKKEQNYGLLPSSLSSSLVSNRLRLPEKKELVVWISLSKEQRTSYEQYVNSQYFTSQLANATYPVELINHLRTLCRHPLLLEYTQRKKQKERQQQQQQQSKTKTPKLSYEEDDDSFLDSVTSSMSQMKLNQKPTSTSSSSSISSSSSSQLSEPYSNDKSHIFDMLGNIPSIERIFQGSIKLRILVKMIATLLGMDDSSHRILVFSQSKLMLQLVQYLLVENNIACFKIDGSTSAKERQEVISEFNSTDEHYYGPRICLLTTKACGVGITLTGADRVIILDPCKLHSSLLTLFLFDFFFFHPVLCGFFLFSLESSRRFSSS
jgi:SNF2 family DNA or RNA helicase